MIAEAIHRNASAKGFWETGNHVPRRLMLIVTEAAEALEVWRTEEPDSEESGEELAEELADIIIRTLDLAAGMGLRIGQAVVRKHRINAEREYLHGKRF